ncbi:MAG: hypothetical protein KF730_05470 [Sphingomonas sp.]|uniref:hypothetical protein n=1 Tax=Sphingomonas sp. TaxID=28214 RepID=UPI0025CBA835|nr:hypothetical protein [Sphingomonas sp.]MBX3564011.1 hypothetical protein [Sphingomonas sp.]
MMASFCIHLMGQRQPITLDLPCADIGYLVEEASRAKFLVGHMAEADEEGVCRRVMIATCRIECAVEVG